MVTRKKKQWKRIVWVSMVILGVVMFIPSAEAEQPFDITCCYSGKLTVVSESKELNYYRLKAVGCIPAASRLKVLSNAKC